jgi:hypothetical protein
MMVRYTLGEVLYKKKGIKLELLLFGATPSQLFLENQWRVFVAIAKLFSQSI